ncbi:MAG: 3-dehydroquinate synthase [Burkholderiales bacterium]
MRTVDVDLVGRAYPILIGSGLLDRADLYMAKMPHRRVAVVTNTTVAALYLERLSRALAMTGVDILPVIVADGEQHKTWETLNLIFDSMLAHRCERSTTVIALGGGVVGDLAGFAAATFQRGVPLIQVPTTLLAQVDSAVGGKTAINHPLGKNMIGAFHQPRLVLTDIDTLSSLPERELAAGLAEVVKYGLIMDLAFFEWLEQNMERLRARDAEALGYAVQRSCEDKASVVAADERESGQRALLNLGHTFGHAIENGLGYGRWLHGEAVAAGTMMAARLSERLGYLNAADVARIESLLRRAGLPTQGPALGEARYLELMGHDKKVQEGRLRLVLLRSIGAAFVTADFGMQDLGEVLAGAAAHA